MPEDAGLLDSWVEILNEGDLGAIPETFTPDFVDHHPPLGGQDQSLQGVADLVRTLHQEHNDMHFVLEDAFGAASRLGYRLFGEGVMQVGFVGLDMKRPHLIHFQVTAVGIFEVRDGRLSQRWGPVLITEAANRTPPHLR
jgi:hypothetical protein